MDEMKEMDELFAQSLREYPEDYFNELDSSAIAKCMGAAIGYWGATAREAGIDILERYITWVKKQPEDSFEDNGIDPMAALKKMEEDLQIIKQFIPDYEHRDQLGPKFIEFKTSLQQK
jgi:hypothetical protein